jgi:DNA-binding transcriptional LysR family regulator
MVPSRLEVNLASLDLISVRLVLLCAEEGSLGRAAQRAHLSLTGASHRLTRFEQRLGKQLFERHRRGLRLTEAGRQMIPLAADLFEAVARFCSSSKSQ